MNPTRFLYRALLFPFLAGFVDEDNLGPIQFPHSTSGEQEGSDALEPETYSTESTVGSKTEYIVITHIRATDFAIRLRRIPVGFYISVKTENGTKQTSTKPASVGKDMVEWDDEIVLPSDPPSRVSLIVFASFELGPTLGDGEAIHKFEITVGELLDRNEPLECDGNIDASRSSLAVDTERRVRAQNEHVDATDPPKLAEMREIRELTDRGHLALTRYRELQEQQDLDESIRCFEQAEDLCPSNHPNRATILFNLANAKLMYSRVNATSPDLDIPINLYRDVLRLRPRDHSDHPFTLLSLGVALEARCQRQRNERDEGEGRLLLSQVLDVAQADSYAYHVAVLALGSAAKFELIQSADVPQATEKTLNDEKVQRLDAALQWTFHPYSRSHAVIDHLGILFCIRLRCLDDLGDPGKVTSTLEAIIPFTSDDHPDKRSWLDDLSISLWTRYERFGDYMDMEKSISIFEDAVRLTPDSDPDKPFRLTILGSSLSSRYKRFGGVADLERSISLREDALRSTPDGHPDKPAQLNNLGCSMLARYKRFGGIVDLERSISLAEDALRFTPTGHSDKPVHLNNLGNALSIRYEHFGDVADLEKLISLREDVLQCTPDDHPYHPLWLNNLGDSLTIRYERAGDVVDLERSISLFEGAVKFTPDGHPDKPLWLNSLSRSLSNRYKRFRDVPDLDRSISLAEDVVQLTPDGHPAKPVWLNNLSCSLSARYERFGDISDLDKSTSLMETVVRSTPDDHPDRLLWPNNLGISLSTRYQRFGDIMDLERMISLFEDVVKFTPNSHPAKPLRLNNLGDSLKARYKRFGDINDLERSISLFKDALQYTPDGHPKKPTRLNNLGHTLLTRYQRLGDVADLERSIALQEDALQSAPDDHPDKPLWLNSLGSSLSSRYERFGDVVDLERSIAMLKDAMQFTPDDHPDKPSRLNTLGSLLSIHYERFGEIVDLNRSISLGEDAVQLTPDGHPEKPALLNNLSHSLSARYGRFGDIVDLDRSIPLAEDAVQFTPDGHPDKPRRLNNLGRCLSTRFKRFGDTVDLERSISLCEDAVRSTPDGHPRKPLLLDALSASFLARYNHSGDVVDLEKSILLRENAVQFMPSEHPDKSLLLNNLSSSFSTRYQQFGDVADMEKTISLLEDVMRLTPDGHPDKPTRLNNLGQAVMIRYELVGDIMDLDRSISLLKDALHSTPDDHSNRPFYLNNLGQSLLTRYERSGDILDLERSISLTENAVQSTPDGHSEKPLRLNNFAKLLTVRYQRFGDFADLEKSISVLEDAVRSTPDGHPSKPSWLNSLAISVFLRSQHPDGLSSTDLSRVVLLSSCAARSHTGPSSHRFRASWLWARSARLLQHDPQSILDAYMVVVELVPQLAWIGLSLHARYRQLLQAADVVCDAAAAALEIHRPEVAVEWLEQGRSIVWSQLSQLRTPVDDLRDAYPDLAAQFERISRQLEHASVRDREDAVHESTNHSNTEGGILQKEAQQHHALAVSRERLLKEIRAIPGFERFLLPRTISQLSSLVRSGPVVLLNASKYRCDALVVIAGSERVIHVPLSNTNYDEVVGMQSQLRKLLTSKGRVILRDASDRGARVKEMTPDDVFKSVLPYLWEKVVSPILEVLPLSTPDGKLPRIFWCPTGPFSFLPIHAAGIYGTVNPHPRLSDFAVSSYIPTMSALALPPPGQEDSEASSRNICLLAVPQPGTDGQAYLTGVQGEIEVIRKLASSSPFVDFQEADGTVEDVLSKMTESDWVHFACHGTQDRANPYDSGFLLAHGKRLKLPDIARLSRPHRGLAFLSACHTAAGDEQLSGETIHIAAGMLLAGYRGVIATMWSILDRDAPRVTEDVYKSLFNDGKVPDGRHAAEALHDAIEQLRDSGTSFLSWVPFIHVGL